MTWLAWTGLLIFLLIAWAIDRWNLNRDYKHMKTAADLAIDRANQAISKRDEAQEKLTQIREITRPEPNSF